MTIEINTTDLTKSKRPVNVKATPQRKGHIRMQEVGVGVTDVTDIPVTVTSKSGVSMKLIVSGKQHDPRIKVDETFSMGGKKITGMGDIQHWKSKGVEEGLFFRGPNVYVQCASEIGKVKDAIAKLPIKAYMAKKVKSVIDADGDKVTVTKWKFDKPMRTEKGTVIPDSVMGRFLNDKNVNTIDIKDAVKMWTAEAETEYIDKKNRVNTGERAVFDDDVGDAGYTQAAENAGIPRHLR